MSVFLLDQFLSLRLDDVEGQFCLIDVDEVDNINQNHGHSDDKGRYGVFEYLAIEIHERVQDIEDGRIVVISAVQVDSTSKPVLILVDSEQIGQS